MNKILAFSGSNSSVSINQRLIKAVAKLVDGIDIIDLRDYDAPIYSLDIEGATGLPKNIVKLYDVIQQYDSIVIASPEYNGLPTSFFKNILDWLSRNQGQKFLQDKKVILLSTSPGAYGGASALAKLKDVVPYWGATVVGTHSMGNFFDNVDANNNLISQEDQEAIKALLSIL